jgi:hypothetical protein
VTSVGRTGEPVPHPLFRGRTADKVGGECCRPVRLPPSIDDSRVSTLLSAVYPGARLESFGSILLEHHYVRCSASKLSPERRTWWGVRGPTIPRSRADDSKLVRVRMSSTPPATPRSLRRFRDTTSISEIRPASRLVHSCASEFRPARPDALVTETRGRETDRLGGTPPCPLFTLLLLGTADIVVC